MALNSASVKRHGIAIALLVTFFGALGSPALAFDISGEYKGFYQYYDQRRHNIVGHFTISIKQHGNAILGQIKEPRTDFGPRQPFLYSDFKGIVAGNENSFSIRYTKRYRFGGNPIIYTGNYTAYLGEIQGEWNIGSYKGNFKISNISPKPDVDLEQPSIMVIKPDFITQDRSAGEGRGLKIVKQTPVGEMEVAGLAADNVKIDWVRVNGQEAYILAPAKSEQKIMRGNSVKFSATVNLSANQEVKVEAMDINGNSSTLRFKLAGDQRPEQGRVAKGSKTSAAIYAKNYAVVIGINQYRKWPPLEAALNDAQGMQRFLEKQGYKIIALLDQEATRNNILKVLGYELPSMVESEDSVLVYFAGHGYTESLRDGGQEGYIVPVDAGTSDCFLSAISMRQLKSITQRIKAKHILFIMDSCYSGLGFARSAGISVTESQYIKKISSLRAVQMITAGGMNEQAIEEGGHGLFTKNLLNALGGAADLDRDGIITGSELGTYLRPVVTKASNNRQTPAYGRFEGEGEYIFRINK
jgi:Caspase domain